MSTPETTLTPDDIDRIVAHMNDDHADSVLAYVRHFGKQPGATQARILSLDPSGLDIRSMVRGQPEDLRIQFDHPLQSAHDAHMTMVRMSREAKRALGG
ncbi:MAG: DUF2470 domain-containing protein [Verrucomicrobiota bacterium]